MMGVILVTKKEVRDIIRSTISLIDTTMSDIKKIYRRLKVLRNRLNTFLEESLEDLEEEAGEEEELEEELTREEEEKYFEI